MAMNAESGDAVEVAPASRVEGTVRVPGDKSISHRAAMLAALASGESSLDGFLLSDDCLSTLRAVESLGAGVRREGGHVVVDGTGGRFRDPGAALDMGNSGTGMRLICGLLAGHEFTTELTGDESLRSRPMGRIGEPLEKMGARVELLGPGGCAPVRIGGGDLHGIEYHPPVASAQVKSCVLLAGLFAEGATSVVELKHTRDHTERMLRAMGVEVQERGLTARIAGGRSGVCLAPLRVSIPGDFSSAAFWLVAGAVRDGAEVLVEGVGLNPRRTALLDVLRRMGADVDVRRDRDAGWEPTGSISVRGGRLHGTVVGGDEIPNLIDELPLVAVAGAAAQGETRIEDAAELRVKESDRISAVAEGLRAIGAVVNERPDGMLVKGASGIAGGCTVRSLGDHRVAMSMAVLALCADSPVTIEGVKCVDTSYPGFWQDLEHLAT